MKLLLLGGQGQLGWELQRALTPLGRVTVADRAQADFEHPESVRALVRSQRPEVIVVAAGFTEVDRAEQQPGLANTVNALTPGALALEAAAQGSWLLQYSTDYVFDGRGDLPWQEADAPAPLNAYGRSKLAGEEAIRASGCRHLILRTSWLHAPRGRNFVRTILAAAAERDRLDVVDDQIGAPTSAELLADLSAHLLRAALAEPALAGTYHACAGGQTSWCACARHVLAEAARHGWRLRAQAADVHAVTSASRPSPAMRPLNSRLDTSKLRMALGLHLPDWRDGITRTVAELAPR